MIQAGVAALAKLAPALEDPDDSLLPELRDLRMISCKIATAVANAAREEGVAGVKRDAPFTEEEIRARQWDPGEFDPLCQVPRRARSLTLSSPVYRPLEFVEK